jgi:hypothetical protein
LDAAQNGSKIDVRPHHDGVFLRDFGHNMH